MSRIDYFDADAGAVHVGYAPPLGQPGMPGALVLVDYLDDLPILGHAIMGRNLRSRVGHPLYGGCCISHAGIMQNQHGDWQHPLIEIGRGGVARTASLGNGLWHATRMVTVDT